MNRPTLSLGTRLALGIGIALFAVNGAFADPPTELQKTMDGMGAALKSLQGALQKIKTQPGDHSADWATAKTAGQAIATGAGNAKTLFPPTVAGNPSVEQDFDNTLEDLRATIANHLIKAIDNREIGDAVAALNEIVQERNAAHEKFNPQS